MAEIFNGDDSTSDILKVARKDGLVGIYGYEPYVQRRLEEATKELGEDSPFYISTSHNEPNLKLGYIYNIEKYDYKKVERSINISNFLKNELPRYLAIIFMSLLLGAFFGVITAMVFGLNFDSKDSQNLYLALHAVAISPYLTKVLLSKNR